MVTYTTDQGVLEKVVRKIIELHVHTGTDGCASSLLRCGAYVMHLVETSDCAKIGQDEALKAPLPPENLFEEQRICSYRDTIDLVVGRHSGHSMAFAEGGLE